MKNIKNGFTIAEILVALGVAGVVAALVLPQLVNSTQKDSAGAILGRAVSQIELGCQNLIQDYNASQGGASLADTLSALDGDFKFSLKTLAPYIGATEKPQGKDIISAYQFNQFPATLTTKATDVLDANNTLPDVIIDVNGKGNKPDKYGVDQFVFDLQDDGRLIPHGLNKNTCDGTSPSKIDENCTARVVKDGFKIKYNH